MCVQSRIYHQVLENLLTNAKGLYVLLVLQLGGLFLDEALDVHLVGVSLAHGNHRGVIVQDLYVVRCDELIKLQCDGLLDLVAATRHDVGVIAVVCYLAIQSVVTTCCERKYDTAKLKRKSSHS